MNSYHKMSPGCLREHHIKMIKPALKVSHVDFDMHKAPATSLLTKTNLGRKR